MTTASPDISKTSVDEELQAIKGPAVEEVYFPEGGFPAWLSVVGGRDDLKFPDVYECCAANFPICSAIVAFCSLGSVQTFIVFETYYTKIRLTHSSPADVSWIGSIQIFLLFFIGLFSGKLFDAGYVHHCLIGGSTLYILFSFILAATDSGNYLQHMLIQGIGMGFSMGLMFLPAISVSAHYFKANLPIAMGTVLAGAALGAVVKPAILRGMLLQGTFARAIVTVASLELVLLVLANALIRTRIKVDPKAKRASLFSIKKDTHFMVFVFGSALAFWGLYIPYFCVQQFAVLHGVPIHVAKLSIIVMNGSSIFGRTLPNLLAQWLGNLNVMIPCTFVTGSLVWALFRSKNTVGLISFAIVYGFFSGAVLSLGLPTAASFAKSVHEIGSRNGMLLLFLSFAAVTGNPIAGVLLNPPQYTWLKPLTFSSIVICLGGGLLILARYGVANRMETWRV